VRSTVWPHEKFLVRGRPPSLAAGLRVYAIGDIHGRLDLLNQLLSLIDADIAQFPAIRPVYVSRAITLIAGIGRAKRSTDSLSMMPSMNRYS
jgi:hypothetical protein